MDIKQIYDKNKAAELHSRIQCICGTIFDKRRNDQCFCSTQCRGRYWDTVDPKRAERKAQYKKNNEQ